jgi:hypothetical protein
MKKLQMDAMANLPKRIGFTGEEKKDKDFCYKGEIPAPRERSKRLANRTPLDEGMIDDSKEDRNSGHSLKSCGNDINQDGFGDKGDSDYPRGNGSTSWDTNSNDDGTTKNRVICRIHGCNRK